MITGVVPFQGESPITVALKHIRDLPMPPSQRSSEVPAELEHIILRALEKDPERRYGSAQGMRNALEKFLEDHAAGLTHIVSGDFPTMDFKGMKAGHARRLIDEEEEFDEGVPPGGKPARGRPARRSRAWIWVLAIALLVIGALGAAAWSLVGFLEVPEVKVPSIEGMALVEAQRELANAGLDWQVQTGGQYSLTVPAQAVISSKPPPGTPVKKGRRIDLVLSKGKETRQLSDVRNRPLEEARAILETDNFKVDVTQRSAQAKEGTVIDQLPAPLTPVEAGSMVRLIVSSGPLRVPAAAGKSVDEARRLISVAGLTPGTVQSKPDPAIAKDTVIATDPPAETPVVAGQTVNLTVSSGPPAPEGKPFEKVLIIPGEGNKQHDVRVTLVDTIDGKPAEQPPLVNEKRRGGEKVPVRGTFFGPAYLRVIVDGIEMQKINLP
jgi:serine/threonine-protein kinase